MVPDSEHGCADHLPAGLLRVPGGQEVVGAVLQAALARHHRHLSQGDRGISFPKKGEFEGGRNCILLTVKILEILS